jgi:hypothetical protein
VAHDRGIVTSEVTLWDTADLSSAYRGRMTDPAASAVKAHYRARWGAPSRTARFSVADFATEVLKWDADRNPEQVNLYATVGASAHVIDGHDVNHRLELFVGLSPAQDDVAKALAALVAETVLNHVALADGISVTFSEPLWPGTDMRSFLVLRPRVEIIPALALRGQHVEFMQAIPVFAPEVSYKTRHGAQDLLNAWRAAAVAFWNPARELLSEFAEVDVPYLGQAP